MVLHCWEFSNDQPIWKNLRQTLKSWHQTQNNEIIKSKLRTLTAYYDCKQSSLFLQKTKYLTLVQLIMQSFFVYKYCMLAACTSFDSSLTHPNLIGTPECWDNQETGNDSLNSGMFISRMLLCVVSGRLVFRSSSKWLLADVLHSPWTEAGTLLTDRTRFNYKWMVGLVILPITHVQLFPK